ncbi:hypothetical protein DMN91_005096 [Ooceraea biroi]|uniref:Uncharacterized protein n=1 Tax=Ooceraea biroi TaxID=2015173 RepID=A0A3L8DSS5_OOCBI|nr:glutamic acid-rich protein-like [Ooceraea biroi]RLU22818.1 hypothetical protein DMN91_005096 [Ooceraea biroi]
MAEESVDGDDIFHLRKLFGMEGWEEEEDWNDDIEIPYEINLHTKEREEEWVAWLKENWDDDIDAILETSGEDLEKGLRIEEEDDDIQIVFERKRLRRDDDDDEDVVFLCERKRMRFAEEDDEECEEECEEDEEEQERR